MARRPKPVMVMITPGRRGLGEDWRKINVYAKAEGGYELDNVPTEAPADGKPIYVPALGNISVEMANWILEYERKEAEYRRAHSLAPPPLDPARLNQMWHDYIEEKLRWFKRQTSSGPALTRQRD